MPDVIDINVQVVGDQALLLSVEPHLIGTVVLPTGPRGPSGRIETIVAGDNIVVDNTDPANPIVGTTGVLELAGGTMTGPLVLDDDPATDLGAATKQYVDDLVAAVEASDVDSVNGRTGAVTGVADKPATTDAVVYLSTNGNDSGDGLSWGSAKLTLAAAYAALPSGGGAIEAALGVYSTSSTFTITATKPVRILGTGRRMTVFTYTGSGSAFKLDGTGVDPNDAFEFDGFGITCSAAAATKGIELIHAHRCTIRNVRVLGNNYNAGSVGIYGDNAFGNYLKEGVCVEGFETGVDLDGVCHDFTIDDVNIGADLVCVKVTDSTDVRARGGQWSGTGSTPGTGTTIGLMVVATAAAGNACSGLDVGEIHFEGNLLDVAIGRTGDGSDTNVLNPVVRCPFPSGATFDRVSMLNLDARIGGDGGTPALTLTSNCSAPRVRYALGSGATISNSSAGGIFYEANGRIGVGTATPASGIELSGADILLANNRTIRFRDSGGTSRRIGLVSGGNAIYYGDVDNAMTSDLLLLAGSASGIIHGSVNGTDVLLVRAGNVDATSADIRVLTASKAVKLQSGSLLKAYSDAGTTQTAQIDSATGAVTPGTTAGLGGAIYAGSGAPGAIGTNGDFYLRSGGTAAGDTLIYHKESGSWVALAPLTALADHIADSSAAHAATAVSFTPAAGIAATTVQAAIEEVVADIDASDVDSVNGATGTVVLTASDIGSTATGDVAATTVQGAIAELASEKATTGSVTTVQTNLDNHLADTADAHDASAISSVPAGTLAASTVQAALDELDSEKATTGSVTTVQSNLDAHIADSSDAHDASAISIADAGNDFTATTVEGALDELQADHEADVTALADHIADSSAAHAASAVSFSPTGTIAATDAQAAIAEVASEAASALTTHEADTTSVHGITDTSTLYRSGGTDVAVADGGTGASTAATARTNLDVEQLGCYPSVNAQTGTTYTFVAGDRGLLVTCSNASAIAVTVPLNSSVAFPVGTRIDVIQIGAGQVTVQGAGGVTLNSTQGTDPKCRAQYSAMTLIKTATDTWLAVGDIA